MDTALPAQPPARLPVIIPMIVATAFLMEMLDSTILTTAVPDIARNLGVSPVQMSLAVAAYVLSVAVFIPVSGWFADRFGARRIFVLAIAIFTLGSALCGLAQSFPMLVAMRVLQGLGGAMMTPVGRLILLRSFPRSELLTAMTYVTIPALIGPIFGPLLGGVLTTYLSWRWIFYVNLPFGLLGMALALRFVKNVAMPSTARFDFPGFLLVGLGLGSLQFGLETVSRPLVPGWMVLLAFAAASLLLAGFAFYARGKEAPAIDLGLFRWRSFRIGSLAGGLCRVGMNGVPFLLPLMLQLGFGLSPVESGSITFVGAFGALASRNLLAAILRRHGFRPLLNISAVLGALAIAGFAFMGPQTPHWLILIWMFLFGLTRSAQFMTSNTLSYADLPDTHLSRATSLGGALQQLSVSFGVSLSAVVLGLISHGAAVLTTSQFHEAFLVVALIPLLALPGFAQLRPGDGRGATKRTQTAVEVAAADCDNQVAPHAP